MELKGLEGTAEWAALRASHLLALKKPLSSVLVPLSGFEPESRDPQSRILSVELQGRVKELKVRNQNSKVVYNFNLSAIRSKSDSSCSLSSSAVAKSSLTS